MSFFKSPGSSERTKALGDIKQLPKDMKLALTNRLDDSFEPVPIPGSDDWLSIHAEKGQTMLGFNRTKHKAVPAGTCKTIYIQPVGRFDSLRAALLYLIIEFAEALFAGCDVELLPILGLTAEMERRNKLGQLQYHADGFFDYLSQTSSRRDSRRELLCVAVTMADIYNSESGNYVNSCMSSSEGFGVLSFARLHQSFLASPEQLALTAEEHRIIIRRGVKVLIHTIGWLFGLKNCIYYNCLMNNFNHEEEQDRSALYLCPICLRKLYSTLKFDVRRVYEEFANLCEKYGLEEDRAWYRKRLDYIRNQSA